MAESKLKIDVRRSKILEQLKLDGKVSVSRLAEELGATPVTIRNDLTALERDGYLVRMQGGAVIAPRLEHHLTGNTEDATFLQKQALKSYNGHTRTSLPYSGNLLRSDQSRKPCTFSPAMCSLQRFSRKTSPSMHLL